MTDERVPTPPPRARTRAGDALLDGIPAGLAAAVVLLVGSLVRDRAAGDALATLTRVGALLLRDPAVDPGVAVSARAVTTGVAFVLLECMVLGALVAWLLPRLRRAPTVGLTFTATLAALLLAFYALDRASGADLPARLSPWAVLAGHALAAGAMTVTLWARRPQIPEGRREIREDEP